MRAILLAPREWRALRPNALSCTSVVCRGRGVDEIGGGEVTHLVTGTRGGVAQPDQDVALACTWWTNYRQIMLSSNPFQVSAVVDGGGRGGRGGDVKALEGLDHREGGALEPVGGVGASRAAISASTRVRNTSSGVHRCVFAVNRTLAAVRRTVASLSRRNPAARPGGRGGIVLGATVFVPIVVMRRSRHGWP